MSLVQIAAVLVAAATLLPLAIRGVVWRHVRTRRVRQPDILDVAPELLPEALDPLFDAAEAHLRPLGFRPEGARWVGSAYASEGPRPERVYAHPESGALAFVGPPLQGMGERPYRIHFVSQLVDGRVVATFDGLAHLTPGFPPGWECHDHDINDLGRQWALHLHALEPHGGLKGVRTLEISEWTPTEVRAFEDTMASWERDGLTRPAADAPAGPGVPTWRFGLRESWALAGRILQGQKRVLTEEAREARIRARQELWRENIGPMTETDAPELDAARAAAMAWAYDYARRSRVRQAAERPQRQAAVLAAVSGLASVAVLGWWVGWELAWIVIGVLLLHELGHLAAMEAFGYRERRVLFIPFFGAAALGDGEDATPSQRTLVYLLGPAPGILLGLASLYAYLQSGELWWLAAATTALLVNYLNLLPISPLDGGRVVETLLLGRYPRAQVAFLGTGALLFGVGAWVLRDPILAGISLVLLTSLKGAWTAAGLLLRARERLPERASEGQRIREVFALLQEPPYATSPAAQRMRWAELVIPRLAHTPAGPRAAVLGGLVYLTMLVGVPVAVTGSIMVFEPALWATLTDEGASTQTPGSLVRYGDEAPAPPPAGEDSVEPPDPSARRSAISEASVVGR